MVLLTADTPIENPEQDQFQRWPFAQRIAQTIASREDPTSIVIGIYGSWGDGKTTVLNFIKRELGQHENVVCFTFNPWRFSDESKMLLDFFHSLAEAVGKSENTVKEKIGDFIAKYLTTVGHAFGQGDTVDSIGKLLSSVELEDLKVRINDILQTEGKRVVILIDDIDRLDKNEIQSIFRLVKLNADFVNTAYILAFDDDMVSAALQEKYSSSSYESGRSFLEKIIQVPLDLPTIPTSALRHFCFTKVDQALQGAGINLSDEDEQEFVRGYTVGLEIRVKTPRLATRYGNILAFSLPILKGEVNPVDLMLVEGIRLFYPKLYELIRKNPDIFLGSSASMSHSQEKENNRTKELIDTALSEQNSEEKQAIIHLLKLLFPRLESVYGNIHYGYEWDKNWAISKKIASKAYFNRYFSYAIPEGDISDIVVDQFLSTLDIANDLEKVVSEFVRLIKSNSDSLISKLRIRYKSLTPNTSKMLAFIIAELGRVFPNPSQPFSFQGTFSQAAMLVGDLLTNISNVNERFQLAKDIVNKADPITFAAEINRWFHKSDRSPDPRNFSEEESVELKKNLANRVKEYLLTNDVFTEYSNDASYLLTIWSSSGSKEEVSEYVESLIKENPSKVTQLLISFVPISIPMDTGIGRKGDFNRDSYNAVSSLVDPSFIVSALEQLFGDNLRVQEYPNHLQDKATDLRVAQQFVWIHNQVINKPKENDSPATENSFKKAEQ